MCKLLVVRYAKGIRPLPYQSRQSFHHARNDCGRRPAQCGLDYGRREGLAGHDAQLHAFRAQLRLAVELHRPVSVRQCQRDAVRAGKAAGMRRRQRCPLACKHSPGWAQLHVFWLWSRTVAPRRGKRSMPHTSYVVRWNKQEAKAPA